MLDAEGRGIVMKEMSVNILFPVLNERLRLQRGIDRTMEYLREKVDIPYCLTILDNGSEDETRKLERPLKKSIRKSLMCV